MVWKAAWTALLVLFFAGVSLLYIGYEEPPYVVLQALLGIAGSAPREPRPANGVELVEERCWIDDC